MKKFISSIAALAIIATPALAAAKTASAVDQDGDDQVRQHQGDDDRQHQGQYDDRQDHGHQDRVEEGSQGQEHRRRCAEEGLAEEGRGAGQEIIDAAHSARRCGKNRSRRRAESHI